MRNKPVISIIIPIFNGEKFLNQTIESVIYQTYKNWECLLIDDGSKDNSLQIMEYYASREPRIKIIQQKQNLGVSEARNRGVIESKGDFLIFLDADDFWEKDKLKNQITFMQKNNLPLSHTDYTFCDKNNHKIKSIRTDSNIDYKLLLKGNQFKINSVMMKKNYFDHLFFHNKKHEDYLFFLHLLKYYHLISYKVEEKKITTNVRVGHRSVSSNKIKSAYWVWNILRKEEHLSFIDSCFNFICYSLSGIKKHYKNWK